MHPFRYNRAQTVEDALQSFGKEPNAAFLAGGTSQLDLMKEDVLRPGALIDIKRVPLSAIMATKDGGLRLGANASNTAVAYHEQVQKRYVGLAEAILAGASPQIRNMASTGGNLLQRTRCPYYRDTTQACNKREPGTGCAALEGINRVHAVFGANEKCIATHPSDMCVALAALNAVVQVQKPKGGTRSIPFADFHRLPGDEPQRDTVLEPGELITSVDLPAFTGRSHYLKVRERASYAYALVSVAIALEMDGDTIKAARIALGSVAHKPWMATDAAKELVGKKPDAALFRAAAEKAFEDAKPLQHNAYKIPLGKNTLVRALMETSGLMPLQGTAGTAFASSAGGVAGDDIEG
ncbi:MAG: xanthine dehydrogenase family protein subunit M [Armatimonadetes bacterium]|nr:xanthine dehydrogenase family protein subunit M [Armatimonadota bacterium]